MTRKPITTLCLIALSLFASSAHAVWYQVEMIVFQNLYPDTDGENWYTTPGLVPLQDTVELLPYHPGNDDSTGAAGESDEPVASDTVELIPYGILPESKNRLEGIYRLMRLSREYRPVYHLSWQQPGLEGDNARAVYVQAQDALFELSLPPHLVSDPMPADFYEPVQLVVDGSLKIRSSLYLHVDLDMVLFRAPPMNETDTPEDMLVADEAAANTVPDLEPVDYVRLTESRRIRLNELHYFDHPMFGVIVQVSRYGDQ